MLVDDVTITLKAGDGGDGVVRFTTLMQSQGPTGGNGGRGGDVFVEGVSDLSALRPFRHKKAVKAQRGGDGAQNNCHGRDGESVTIPVPVGTRIHDLTHETSYDIMHVGQRERVARGGNGGFGNAHFKSSRNTTPLRANKGKPGEEVSIRLELKLIADVGFVGLPNVGKSSLLNELTNASSKVANYHFTTLEPHLGVYYNLVLADIPGLIAGAADGKGLGHKFLRHIERTRILFHFIAADTQDPLADYHVVRKELESFSKKLAEKEEWIIVSKSDEVTEKKLHQTVAKLAKENEHIITLSLLTDGGTDAVKKVLAHLSDNK